MEEILFEVQGSASEPYGVVFVKRSPTSFSAYCSCPTRSNDQVCKHKLAILSGIQTSVVSSNKEEVNTIQTWLKGSDVETALKKVNELEIQFEHIRKELITAKKILARSMLK